MSSNRRLDLMTHGWRMKANGSLECRAFVAIDACPLPGEQKPLMRIGWK
jgi:hypothetical protein